MNDRVSELLWGFGDRLEKTSRLEDVPAAVYECVSSTIRFDWLNLGVQVIEPDGSIHHDNYSYRGEGFAEAWWRFHKENLVSVDFMMDKLAAAKPGDILGMECYDPANEGHRYAYEMARQRAYTQDALVTILTHNQEMISVLALYRDDAKNHFSNQDRAILRMLTPLLGMTLKKQMLLRQTHYLTAGLEVLLAQRHRNILIVNDDLVPLFLSEGLTELFGKCLPKEALTKGIPTHLLTWLHQCLLVFPEQRRVRGLCSLTMETLIGPLHCDLYSVQEPGTPKPLHLVLVSSGQPKEDFSSLEKLGLTKKETDTLSFLPLGYTNPQIAQTMKVKEVTVKKRIQRIGQKLGAKGRTEILYAAMQAKKELSGRK